MQPLADKIRPTTLAHFVGQAHFLAPDKLIRKSIESGRIPNMVFHGPSGTGKTTLAHIIAANAGKSFFKLNATTASTTDIREVIKQKNLANGALLYLDEVQAWNRKQQQSILEFIETGEITLIASTTENPYFYVYNAILSRSTVLEFHRLNPDDILKSLLRGISILQQDLPLYANDDALDHIAHIANGDLRRALNALELAAYNILPNKDNKIIIDLKSAEQATGSKAFSHDRDGDNHYDVLSALQKSIRGSDPDAALHYLARLVTAEDIQSICRRLLVIAAEDIGLAYPTAITIVKSCTDAALQLGFPEARIPLAQATVLLATAPKSNSAYLAMDAALHDIATKDTGTIPPNIRGGERNQGYIYPHDFEHHWVKQKYLPKNLEGTKYYTPQNNKFENNIEDYWKNIKS